MKKHLLDIDAFLMYYICIDLHRRIFSTTSPILSNRQKTSLRHILMKNWSLKKLFCVETLPYILLILLAITLTAAYMGIQHEALARYNMPCGIERLNGKLVRVISRPLERVAVMGIESDERFVFCQNLAGEFRFTKINTDGSLNGRLATVEEYTLLNKYVVEDPSI